MKLVTTRPTHDTTEHANRQPVRLPGGWYAGMFANYSEPMRRPKYQSNEIEERIVVAFLITHNADEQRLEHFSEAVRAMSLKMFWDPQRNLSSKLFEFYAALLSSGKHAMTPEEIVRGGDEALPDLDLLIGYPAMLLIEPATKPNRYGVYRENIRSFLPATPNLRKSIGELYRTAEFERSNRGLLFLKSPKPEYEPLRDSATANISGQY